MAAIGKMKKSWAKIYNAEHCNYLRHEFTSQATEMTVQYTRGLGISYINNEYEEVYFRTVRRWRALSEIVDSPFSKIGDYGISLDKKILEGVKYRNNSVHHS